MAFMFENLDVYQKAVNLADEVAALTERFPRGYYAYNATKPCCRPPAYSPKG